MTSPEALLNSAQGAQALAAYIAKLEVEINSFRTILCTPQPTQGEKS
jgi:hypothetical protein